MDSDAFRPHAIPRGSLYPLPRPIELRPVGLARLDGDAACSERRSCGARIGNAIEAQHGKAAVSCVRARDANLSVAGHHRDAGVWRKVAGVNRYDAVSRGAAMLHARHHLLADVAALVEIHALKLIHVGLVREGVAIDEVNPAARHALRDA